MKRPKAFWKEIGVLIFLASLVAFVYRRLPLTFFQQDEWHSLGAYIAVRLEGNFSAWFSYLTSGSFFGHFNPLVEFFNIVQFTLFGLNFAPYAYLSIFFHFINSLLVYFFVTRLTKNKVVGFLTGILFSTWGASYQAVTWIGTYAGTLGATLFLLLSLIFFLKYQDKNKLRKYYYLSLGMLLISLGFKETTVFLFIFFPTWSLFNIKKTMGWRFSWLKEQKPLVLSALIYLGLRALTLLTNVKKYSVVIDKSWDYLPITIYNLAVMPLATISQIFIPESAIRFLVHRLPNSFFKSKFFTGIHSIPIIPDTLVSLFLSFLIIALIIIIIICFRRRRETKEASIILLTLIWIGIAGLPFAFLGRPLAFLEGRYYYVSALGAALFLSLVILRIAGAVKQKLVGFRARNAVYYGLMGLLVVPILIFHSAKISQDIERSVKIGDEQKAILSRIKKTYPVIGQKSVFYVEPLMYPTFYSGFGHILMVLYACEGQLNPKFIEDDFLWDIRDQGYQEIEENGFGYFRQYSKLIEAAREFYLSPENIYAFRYDAKTKKLENISDEIKNSTKYFGKTAYISKPQKGRKLLGIPDGQRRSFSSDEFVPSEIKEVVNLADNEEWIASDFIAQQSQKVIPGTKDYLITYNYGLEDSYGGTYLVYHLTGNGTGIYHIPGRLYGYQVAGFSGINSALKGNSITKKIIQRKDGSFEVTLLSAFPSSQTIEFTLLLNTKVMYYQPGRGISDIVTGQYTRIIGDGENKKFVIPLSGILKSLRSYWESDDLRYQPQAFVDGVMTPIAFWGGINTSFLTIEFEKPPARDAIVNIPILTTYAPKASDIIKIVNF